MEMDLPEGNAFLSIIVASTEVVDDFTFKVATETVADF